MRKLICLMVLGLVGGNCFAEEGYSVMNIIEDISEVIEEVDSEEVITELPDLCETPAGPGGPVPIPYPNTSMSSDTTEGSKKVKTEGSMPMIKGASYSKSESDEPGTDEGQGIKELGKELERELEGELEDVSVYNPRYVVLAQ